MTWGNPPKFKPDPPKTSKPITPEMLAASGSEDGNQAALFCWAALNTDKYPCLEWLHAIPNGGQRHIVEAMKFVAGGLRAGVWDIFLPYPMHTPNNWFGLYIEMKEASKKTKKNGGLTDEQIEFGGYAFENGYCTAVCYNWEEARDTLIAYLEGKL